MSTIASLKSALPGFFSYEEIKASGPVTLTIRAAGIEKVGQGDRQEEKPVLSFAESKKKLVLNKTRCDMLAQIFGGTSDPVGKRITLREGTVKINGRSFDMVVLEAAE